MKRIIILILILFSSFLFAKYPKVYVSISPKKISSGEKLEVTVTAVAKKGSKFIFPKIDKIAAYKTISQKAEVSYSIKEVDGKKIPLIKRSVTYIIKPDKSFDMDVFTIKIDKKKYKTVPFRVKVKKKADIKKNIKKDSKKDIKNNKNQQIEVDKSSNSETLMFKMSSNKKEVVVGETFIVKVELFEPLDLSESDFEYIPPKFNGFDARPLGDGKILESGNSVIKTIEYLVTPKKAGNLEIKPAIAKIGIQLTPQAQSPFGFFGTNIQWKRVKTNPLTIKVKKLPKDVDLVGIFRIKGKVDTPYAKANKPFDYTIEIDGIGTLDNIVEPKFNIKGITSYSDDAKIEHTIKGNNIYSKFTKKYIFISDKDFIIPSIKFKIYSPSDKQIHTIKTKPYKVKVRKNRTIAETLSNIKEDVQKALENPKSLIRTKKAQTREFKSDNKELTEVEKLLFDKYYYKKRYSIEGYPFSALLGAFILGILIGGGGVLLNRSIIAVIKKATGKERAYNSYEEALTLLYPHITESKNIENMVENLYEVVNGNTDLKIDDYALNKMVKRVKKGKKVD